MFREHGVEDGNDPVFEEAVVVVGHDEIADSVEAFGTELRAGRGEGAHVGVAEAFYQVFFYSAGRGDDC